MKFRIGFAVWSDCNRWRWRAYSTWRAPISPSVDVSIGSGSRYIAILEDATGSVPVRVPEHLRRTIGEGRTPGTGGH